MREIFQQRSRFRFELVKHVLDARIERHRKKHQGPQVVVDQNTGEVVGTSGEAGKEASRKFSPVLQEAGLVELCVRWGCQKERDASTSQMLTRNGDNTVLHVGNNMDEMFLSSSLGQYLKTEIEAEVNFYVKHLHEGTTWLIVMQDLAQHKHGLYQLAKLFGGQGAVPVY